MGPVVPEVERLEHIADYSYPFGGEIKSSGAIHPLHTRLHDAVLN
jgi:hypothetical protein